MKLVQFYEPGQESGVGVVKEDHIIDLTEIMPEVETVNELMHIANDARLPMSEQDERVIQKVEGQLAGYT